MYQTLYRKYRPQTFADVVGQRHVTQLLKNSIKQGKISHAYLFGGPRGTGKTTVARIFAKAVNCLEPKDGDACGACEVCVSIAENRAPDFIEIDAASNRGIDDIRELRERVHYAPLRFRYKVYVIDEAHMITDAAFNALLKTLEEPPSHTILILCTTLPHKLPLTILSRTLKFDFYRLPLQSIADRIKKISREEGAEIAEESALEIAKLSEGSVRDAISLLEQAIVYTAGKISFESTKELFRLTSPEKVIDLSVNLVCGEIERVAEVGDEIVASGRDPERVLIELADIFEKFLLNRAILKQACDDRGLPYPEISDAVLISAISECWEAGNRLRREVNPTLLFKITLFRLVGLIGKTVAEVKPGLAGISTPSSDVSSSTAVASPKDSSALAVKRPKEPQESEFTLEKEQIPESSPEKVELEESSVVPVFDDIGEIEEETVRRDEGELFPEPPPEAETGSLFELPEKLRLVASAVSGSAVIGKTKTREKRSPQRLPSKAEAREKAGLPQPEDRHKPSAADTEKKQMEPADAISQDARWRNLLSNIRRESLTTFCLLFESAIPRLSENRLILFYPYRLRYFAKLVSEPANMRVLSHFAQKNFGESTQVVVETEERGTDAEEFQSLVKRVKSVFPEAREVDLI